MNSLPIWSTSWKALVRIVYLVALLGVSHGLVAQAAQAAPQKYALLIGIDTYQPAGAKIKRPVGVEAKGRFAVDMVFDNLMGPANDVVQMRTLLTSEKFGFPQRRSAHSYANG